MHSWQNTHILSYFFLIFWIKIYSSCQWILSRFDMEKVSDQKMYFWPVYMQKLWSVEVRWFYYSYHAAFVFVALF